MNYMIWFLLGFFYTLKRSILLMSVERFKSSERMNEFFSRKKHKFPWNLLEIGESFKVDGNEISLEHLRSMAWKQGKALKARFRVIKDIDGNGFEVGRLPLKSEANLKEISSNVANNGIKFKRKQHNHVHVPENMPSFVDYREQKEWIDNYRSINNIPLEIDVLESIPNWCNPVVWSLSQIQDELKKLSTK